MTQRQTTKENPLKRTVHSPYKDYKLDNWLISPGDIREYSKSSKRIGINAKTYQPSFNFSGETVSLLKELKFSYFKSMLSKTRNVYKRRVKVLWTIEQKNREYKMSKGIKKYSSSDILNITNKCLKDHNMRSITDRTLRLDIAYLTSIGLIKPFLKHLGVENGSFCFYKENKDFWRYRFELLKDAMRSDLRDYMKDKVLVGDFEDEIEEIEFGPPPNIEKVTPQIVDTPISDLPISGVITNVIKDNIRYKNSRKEVYFRKKYSSSFKEHSEEKLEKQWKVSKEKLKLIEAYSNNEKTNTNALINLETALKQFSRDYDIEDIVEHFVAEFKGKYAHEVWLMRDSREKANDFDLIWYRRFVEKYQNKYKKIEMQGSTERVIVDNGDGDLREVGESGEYRKVGGIKKVHISLDF